MFRFQYSVVTKAGSDLAWSIFSNCERWNTFTKIYGSLRWHEGLPWEPGSRLEIEILQPVPTVVHHVITSCIPGKRVGWIDHALGAALAQWVTFEPTQEGGTRVHTWGDLVHSGRKINGKSPEDLITVFTKAWYENYRAFCDHVADGAAHASFTPAVCNCEL